MFKYLIMTLTFLSGSVYAQSTLKGEFEFAKKPPYGAVVLFGEDKSREGKEGTDVGDR